MVLLAYTQKTYFLRCDYFYFYDNKVGIETKRRTIFSSMYKNLMIICYVLNYRYMLNLHLMISWVEWINAINNYVRSSICLIDSEIYLYSLESRH